MRAVRISLLILLVLAIGGGLFVYSGAFNVAADDPHWAITHRVLEIVRDRSIAVRARGIDVPANLDDPRRIAIGAREYDDMCEDCHVEPGDDDGDEELRAGMYPRPPNLARRGVQRSPAETFWIVKHGLKMTGMPAWGMTHNDETLWSIVAFVHKLPQVSEAEFDRLDSGPGRGRGGDSRDD